MIPLGRVSLWPAVGVIAAAGLFWLLGYFSGVNITFWQLALLALAAMLVAGVVSGLRPDTAAPPELRTQEVNSPTWRPFADVNRWEDQLIFAEAKPGRFETTTAKTRMVELVDERLRLRRGLTLASRPDECRDLLGDDLHRFLTRPAPDCPNERQLREYLQRIEEI
jgi:hypothetical protein